MTLDEEKKKVFEEAVPTLDPQIKDYLVEKYPDRFKALAEERDAALSKFDSENKSLGNGSRMLAGLSSMLTGRDPSDLIARAESRRAKAREDVLSPFEQRQKDLKAEMDLGKSEFDMGRDKTKAEREDVTFKQEQDRKTREQDPDSPESQAVNSLLSRMGYKGPKITAEKFKTLGPAYEKMYEIEQRRLDRQETAATRAADKAKKAEEGASDDKTRLTNTLYRRTQSGPLGELNKMRTMATTTKLNIDKFNQDPNGYSDYGTLMSSLKSLQGDTSVVREAELKLGKNATSLINKAKNAIDQAINGKALQPEQRKQISQVMAALSDGYEAAYRKAAAPTVTTARKNGIPLDEIFDDPASFDEATEETPEVSAFPRQVRKDGQVATVSDDAELKEALDEGWQ
ncbi:MAG: hypothetical protein IPI28_18905 [Candidatus Omnitrophica bacterium]|nr:hypothetical protein [Candidatus Omnitrophota bacterium]